MNRLTLGDSEIFIADSSRHGRGIFSSYGHSRNSLLCSSLSWELSPDDIALLDQTSIEGFWFTHPDKDGWGLMPIGLAALINCSLKPNCSLTWKESSLGYIGELRAVASIGEGDEILIDYGIGLPPGWID